MTTPANPSPVRTPPIAARQPVPASQPQPTPAAPEPAYKDCPYCSEKILATAKKCKHCGEMLDSQLRAEKEQPAGDFILIEPPVAAPAPPPEPPVYHRQRTDDEYDERSLGRAITTGVEGAILLGLVGLASSQYFPVFGTILEKGFALPWSQARLGLIPVHLAVFGGAGAIVGGTFGFFSSRSSAAISTLVSLVFLTAGAASLYFFMTKGGGAEKVRELLAQEQKATNRADSPASKPQTKDEEPPDKPKAEPPKDKPVKIERPGTKVEPLTEEQMTRWQKFTRDHQGYLVAGFLGKHGEWRFSGHMEWTKTIPRLGDDQVSFYFFRDLDKNSSDGAIPSARTDAQRQARQAGVDATVVVAISGGAEPKVIEWFYDDGNGLQKLDKAPRPNLDDSLKLFLYQTQIFFWER
jgi:hypothetical protein